MTDTAPESAPIETQEDTSAADVIAQQVTQQAERLEFVKDKYRKDGRTEQDAAFEQAKAYAELEKRLGGFTGAPDDYALALDPDITEAGFEFDTEDPLYADAKAIAKELGMNNEAFNKMMGIYAKAEMAKDIAHQKELEAQIEALGAQGKQRIANLEAWGKKNLPPDMLEGFLEAGVSINAIRAMEHIVSKTFGQPVNPEGVQPVGYTETDLRKMQFEKDENGNRRISTDPAFRRKYEDAMRAFYGTGDHVQVVGA